MVSGCACNRHMQTCAYLHSLMAKHCEYSGLNNEMIRDRIMVGLRDATLSEKLQIDLSLTLEKQSAWLERQR